MNAHCSGSARASILPATGVEEIADYLDCLEASLPQYVEATDRGLTAHAHGRDGIPD